MIDSIREDRRLGRSGVVRVVGVERFAGDVALARHRLLVRDVVHLRKAGHVHFFFVVRLQLPEHLHRLQEIRRLVLLVAHDEHMMRDEGAVERRPGFRVDRPGQIDAANLGSGVRV